MIFDCIGDVKVSGLFYKPNKDKKHVVALLNMGMGLYEWEN